MLDFYTIRVKEKQMGRGRPGPETDFQKVVYPDFAFSRSKDLMVRGSRFYAFWDETTGLWCKDLYRLIETIDKSLYQEVDRLQAKADGNVSVIPMTLNNFSTGKAQELNKFIRELPDNYVPLDSKIVFQNIELTKNDYASFRVPYSLEKGTTTAFDQLFETLYDVENLTKIKWAFGSILTGESKNIQKFYALYGKPGTGKSTVLNLLAKLTEGYNAPISVGDLSRFNSDFALESLKDNPLVAIDHEGDLSRLDSNSVLNSVVAHDVVTINVKFMSKWEMRFNTTLFIATNKPIRITDAKSGLIRRLIDIEPTGVLVTPRTYDRLVHQLDFELGAIAHKCIDTFEQLGKDYYNEYRSREMMARTNHLFDFVQENAFVFERDDYVQRKESWTMYKAYCEASGIQNPFPRYVFNDQFSDYWDELKENWRLNGRQTRYVYTGFKKDVFDQQYQIQVEESYDWLDLTMSPSIFDRVMADQPAQYVNEVGALPRKWDNNTTTLKDIDTDKLHMVRPPENLIMIDFDIKDEHGNKSLTKNLEAARLWPPTYAETSKSGAGLHLYYYYEGDVTQLQRLYDLDIEIKPPVGKFAIRRLLTVCNNQEIGTINSGLPLKAEGEHVISRKVIATEHSIRALVIRNLAKDIHPHTKPSVDFIFAILQEAQDQGLEYDVSDLKPAVEKLARSSSNNSDYCLALVSRMKFKSGGEAQAEADQDPPKKTIVFFDVEVFPNLFILSWKFEGKPNVVTWFNPSRAEVAELLDWRLVGFHNRHYDNHILYGWLAGDSNQELYERSVDIINNRPGGTFARAYAMSYTDVHDYSSVKQSLKKWQLELGLKHDEMDHPWDQPLPKELWDRAGEYCENDVRSTEAVHEARHADFQARKILAALSGLRVNDPTHKHVARIIFEGNDSPQNEFNVPDLSEEFPGYVFDRYAPAKEKSLYKGEFVGEGGYVWAKPGLYKNVAYMDIASMHPASLVNMNLFGPYTKNFDDLRQARILIKKGKLGEAGQMFGGKLKPYLTDESESKDLAYALKIALNSVYGYTYTQKYDYPFTHPDNVDNVVAKRGALFMVDLKEALLERGANPVHFKTDSVKIADFTPEDLLFVEEFGRKYGYDWELEGIFKRMALINDAVLIGKWEKTGKWEAVGARFAHPYVYKSLFSKEPIEFDDMVETRMVAGGASIYLENEDGKRTFIGRVGRFVPVTGGGGKLIRVKEGKESALPGTKSRTWLPDYTVEGLGIEERIDRSYFDELVQDAKDELAKFGDVETFLEGE